MFKKKFVCLFLSIFLSILFVFGLIWHTTHRKSEFRILTDEIFRKEVSLNSLNLHYTLAKPAHFHIDKRTPNLPSYSTQAVKNHYVYFENYQNALLHIQKEQLGPEEQYAYELLQRNLSHELNGTPYYYFNEQLSPHNGMQTNLLILLSEYSFYSKQDIEDYLSLLKQIPSYFDELIAFETKKQVKGTQMSDQAINQIVSQCRVIFSPSQVDSGDHFMQESFRDRLREALKANLIKKSDAQKYLARHQEIIKKRVYPAYLSLANSMEKLKGQQRESIGLCNYEHGKEYYAWLLEGTTGSERSVNDLYVMIAKSYYEHTGALRKKLQAYQEARPLNEKEITYFPFEEPADMVAHLQASITDDFPDTKEVMSMGSVHIKQVSPSMEDYTAPAFYLLPPIDRYLDNTIYINQKDVPKGLELYTTLAHEGFPGHLYQTTYFSQYRNDHKLPLIRSILDYGGYVEGWALYCELYSYDYAKTLLLQKTGKTAYGDLYDIYREDRCSQLAMLSLLDIGIHYYGLDQNRTRELLGEYGIHDEVSCQNIYDYIANEPTTYPKYYVGYLEILALKEQAKKLWGKAYSELAFHTFMLETGPSDFTSLTNKLKTYQPAKGSAVFQKTADPIIIHFLPLSWNPDSLCPIIKYSLFLPLLQLAL